MISSKYSILIFLACIILCLSCKQQPLKPQDMIFHAGSANSDVLGNYFSLYNGNHYQCCDEDFSSDKWYTGDYSLSGDTITLHGLKKHHGIPSERFLIRRYKDLDSSYWQWKYPNYKGDWHVLRQGDSLSGSTGDVLFLDEQGKVVFHNNNYFLIRVDKLRSGQR